MMQIVWNYLTIFVFPVIIGGCIRFFCRKLNKAWIVTAVFAVLTVIAVIVAVNPPVMGNEGYGLMACELGFCTAASLIVGSILRIIKKRQNKAE